MTKFIWIFKKSSLITKDIENRLDMDGNSLPDEDGVHFQ